MHGIHCLVDLVSLPEGNVYAECWCGAKTFGGDEAEAFEAFSIHKRFALLDE